MQTEQHECAENVSDTLMLRHIPNEVAQDWRLRHAHTHTCTCAPSSHRSALVNLARICRDRTFTNRACGQSVYAADPFRRCQWQWNASEGRALIRTPRSPRCDHLLLGWLPVPTSLACIRISLSHTLAGTTPLRTHWHPQKSPAHQLHQFNLTGGQRDAGLKCAPLADAMPIQNKTKLRCSIVFIINHSDAARGAPEGVAPCTPAARGALRTARLRLQRLYKPTDDDAPLCRRASVPQLAAFSMSGYNSKA